MTRLFQLMGAFAALTLAACGFMGADGIDGVPITDGVAPFGPDAPVTFCIDGARLTETSRAPGLCRDESHEPTECAVDADCSLPEACVCGTCTLKLCESSAECPEGTLCAGSPRRCLERCAADSECGPEGLCEGGACIRACVDVSECAVGELCLASRCRAIACGPGGPNCGPGEVCTQQIVAARASDPSALSEGREVVLFVAAVHLVSGESAIYRFVSRDGLAFSAEPSAPVVTSSSVGGANVSAPSAVRTPEGVALFFELDDGGGIARALDASGDGSGFGASVVVLSPAEGWEEGRVASPGAAFVHGQVVLAYEGGQGVGVTVGEGSAFENATAPALIPADLEDERFSGVDALVSPALYLHRTSAGRLELRLYVGARGVAQPALPGGSFDVPNFSIAAAAVMVDEGLEGLDFTPHMANPVYGRAQNFAPLEETGPSLVEHRGAYLLYFDAEDGVRVTRNPAR